MKYSKLDNGIYGPPIDLPTSYIVPDGPTYCGGFAELPIETLNSYGFFAATEPTIPEGQMLISYGNGVLSDGVVTYPGAVIVNIPAPTTVTMRQARLQLLALGVLDAVNSAVSGMGAAAQIEWEYASTVERNNSLTVAMAALLEWTEAQTDDYFTAASKL